jgi:D-3-phosphoglycerate dehydrogenase
MKPLIAVCDGLDKNQFKNLCESTHFEVYPDPIIDPLTLKTIQDKISAIVIRSKTQVNSEFVKNALNLKYVIRAGEGTDNIDKLACAKKGVKVSNTPGANNNSAAEHAIALMMTVLRKTAWAHQSMKERKWEKPHFVGLELFEKKVGILGMGRIGQIVAERLSGFRPSILFFDPRVNHVDLPYVEKTERLEDVFSLCDIITLHAPLIKETKNLINSKLLELMKPDSILINCARGGIVNEEDLYNLLHEKKIRGAGVDVFEQEPLGQDHKLRGLSNIVLTPHLGASTKEAQERVSKMVLHQLNEFFLNNNLINEVRH